MCTSGDPEDLKVTDAIAAEVIRSLMKNAPELHKAQYRDNLLWIEKAGENKLVVGSQARILYSGSEVRKIKFFFKKNLYIFYNKVYMKRLPVVFENIS